MTGLLLVLMFVLTIFMVIQFVLRETISGQETELNTLSAEIAAIAEALGLEQERVKSLETELGTLSSNLSDGNPSCGAIRIDRFVTSEEIRPQMRWLTQIQNHSV